MILYTKIAKPKKVHISESKLSVLSEDVYADKLDMANKKAKLKYKKGFDAASSHRSMTPGENIKTDKMDSSGSDTYIVPLKNGINSYNITSIDGKEIMHYFKRHFSHEATNLEIKVGNKKENYELEMERNEVNQFLRQFVNKINFVIDDYVSKHKELTDRKIYKASQVCIYPVKSSSNFNSKMVDMLVRYKQDVFGLPVVKLNEGLLRKDVSNIQKDEDFIAKNTEYYNSRRGYYNAEKGKTFNPGVKTQTHMNGLNSDLNMFKARNELNKHIELLNDMVKRMLTNLYQYRDRAKKGNKKGMETYAMRIIEDFPKYCEIANDKDIIRFARYTDDMGNEISKKNFSPQESDKPIYYREKKSTKKPSVKENTEQIIEILKTYVPQEYRRLKRIKYTYKKEYVSILDTIKVMYREPVDYQIKKIFNDSRMGLKNLFAFDPKELEVAKKQIEGNILVIFDDNVSGGATLSDICAQFLSIGVKYIIPITFGKMFQQWGGSISGGWANIFAPDKNGGKGFVFGDNKTFMFNGKTFNTDQITNPMDAANIYQQTFGKYDKEGATQLWNMWKQVKSGKKPLVPKATSELPTTSEPRRVDISKPLSTQSNEDKKAKLLRDIQSIQTRRRSLAIRRDSLPLRSSERKEVENSIREIDDYLTNVRKEIIRLQMNYSS
jgi:hypothetical protein